MIISIDGKQISLEKVRAWESKRKDIVIKKMVRTFGVPNRNYSPEELAALKRKIPESRNSFYHIWHTLPACHRSRETRFEHNGDRPSENQRRTGVKGLF